VSAGSGTLGLVLGGVLVSALGWRWIFLVNLPVGAIVVAAALRVLPDDRPVRRERLSLARFDAAGAVSVTAGASLLAYAVAQTTSHGWGSARTVLLLCAAAVLLGYFVIHEWRVAADPLLPLSLLRVRGVAPANIVSTLLSCAFFAIFYSTTLYMQQVLHYSALRTGLAYLPFGISILVAASLAPLLVSLGGIRVACAAGSLVSAFGLVLLARVPAAGHLLTDVIVPLVVVGLGGGSVVVSTSVAAMSGVEPARHGVASALLNVTRQLGGALGLAVIATIASGVAARSTAAGHPASTAPTSTALTSGFQAGFAVSAGLVLAGLVAALVLLGEDGRGERLNMIELQAGQ
jgi:predicted MFS family arabinose efflux permease